VQNRSPNSKLIASSSYIMKWCVLAVIFAAPFSKSISEIAISVGIAVLVLKKVTAKDMKLPKTGLEIPLIIFLLTILPSFFNTQYPALSVKAMFTKVLKYVAFYYVIIDSIDTKSKLKDVFVIAVMSAVIVTLDGFAQHYYVCVDFLHAYPAFKVRGYWDSGGFFKGFPTSCFPFPNDLAAWLILVVLPIGCMALFGLKDLRTRLTAALVSISMLGLLLMTKARGAWVGIGASVFYVAVSKKKYWLIALLIIALAVPFIIKMEMAGYIFGTSSIGDRFFMWGTAWEILKNHPVIGNGLNTFFVNFMKYRNDEWKGKKGSYAHNCYLQMACDVGVVGLSGFLWMIIAYFINVVRGIRRIKDSIYSSALLGISMGALAFLIMGFFDTNLYSLNLVTLFWCAIGLSQAIVKIFREEEGAAA